MLQAKDPLTKTKAVPYVPGDLTAEKDRPDSYNQLAQNRFNDKEPEIRKGYPKYREDFSKIPPEPEKSLSEQVDEVLKNCGKEMVSEECQEKKGNNTKKGRILSPIINAISNFNLAKKLHKENLEHDPLPDTITDSIYRKLQMQRILDHDPGMTLKDESFACGVGWKGYPGYGPTKCTKLKIYRPKTCVHHPKKDVVDDRPSSVGSFDRKWRFIRQNKVNPIDLAICWDLSPVDPQDEPKRTTHIDGSNGSQAPAVFSLVHTPKDENENVPKCDGVHGCGPIFDHGARANQEKDFVFDRPRTSVSSKSSEGGSKVSSEKNKRAKSAYDLHEYKDKSGSISEKGSKSSGSLKSKSESQHRSTPNLCEITEKARPVCTQHSCKKLGSRLCVACELKKLPGERKPKTEYKLAFKAGVPHKYVSRTCCKISVPRQKPPYRPLNYGIHSLVPPFSLQKDKRDDYPEHWRLATVYQHSYKPLHTRKRSLLQTVYK